MKSLSYETISLSVVDLAIRWPRSSSTWRARRHSSNGLVHGERSMVAEHPAQQGPAADRLVGSSVTPRPGRGPVPRLMMRPGPSAALRYVGIIGLVVVPPRGTEHRLLRPSRSSARIRCISTVDLMSVTMRSQGAKAARARTRRSGTDPEFPTHVNSPAQIRPIGMLSFGEDGFIRGRGPVASLVRPARH
jgi:hypothetical protein